MEGLWQEPLRLAFERESLETVTPRRGGRGSVHMMSRLTPLNDENPPRLAHDAFGVGPVGKGNDSFRSGSHHWK